MILTTQAEIISIVEAYEKQFEREREKKSTITLSNSDNDKSRRNRSIRFQSDIVHKERITAEATHPKKKRHKNKQTDSYIPPTPPLNPRTAHYTSRRHRNFCTLFHNTHTRARVRPPHKSSCPRATNTYTHRPFVAPDEIISFVPCAKKKKKTPNGIETKKKRTKERGPFAPPSAFLQPGDRPISQCDRIKAQPSGVVCVCVRVEELAASSGIFHTGENDQEGTRARVL